jgi:hypothetical protein
MFKDDETDGAERAKTVAAWFADFKEFRSHGRRVSRKDAEDRGLRITRLEDDQSFQDAVQSVHHAVQHTLSATPTAKLIENHHGRAWIKMQVSQLVQIPQQGQQGQPNQPTSPGQPAGPGGPPLNREARRRQGQRGRR